MLVTAARRARRPRARLQAPLARLTAATVTDPLDGLSVSFHGASLTAALEREAAMVLREASREILEGTP